MSDWITYSPSSGHGNGTITITASTNLELEERLAKLVVQGEYGLSATSLISQDYKITTGITVNAVWSRDVPYLGGEISHENCTIVVYANFMDGTSGDVTDKVTYSETPQSVSANTSAERKSLGQYTFTVMYGSFSQSVSVNAYQNGNPVANPLTFNIISSGTIYWKASGNEYRKTIEYSKNNGEWTNITSTTVGTEIQVNDGDVVKFRGNNEQYWGSYFNSLSTIFNIEGNIMSLIDSTGYATATTLSAYGTFYSLFEYCTGLTSAENLALPASGLGDSCYRQMFSGCTSLTTAPSILPATSLSRKVYYSIVGISCYESMFENCVNLTTAPELPATTLAQDCYKKMFAGCTSLTTAPELPATTLEGGCYKSMFYGCTSLTTAQAILPSTALTDSCYHTMFSGCTSLTTAPELPAEYICFNYTYHGDVYTNRAPSCYREMFAGCTSLATAPELPAVELDEYCYYGMFSGCTGLTTAPSELPAIFFNTYGSTQYAYYCYYYMFAGCTSLTKSPDILAGKDCPTGSLEYDAVGTPMFFEGMFSGCTNLYNIKCLAYHYADIDLRGWVSGVSAYGTFVKNPNSTNWTRGVGGIPTGWTVIDNT